MCVQYCGINLYLIFFLYFSPQPCTEWLFVTVFRQFNSILSPVLLAMIQSNHGLVSGDDLNAILVKDAIYFAVGLVAFDLYDEVRYLL